MSCGRLLFAASSSSSSQSDDDDDDDDQKPFAFLLCRGAKRMEGTTRRQRDERLDENAWECQLF